MTSSDPVEALAEVLRQACVRAGVDCVDAQLLKSGENTIYRLPGKLVARISRPGQLRIARREVAISRWLVTNGIPAVQAVPDISQPVQIADRSVTFWFELPPHRNGTPAEVEQVLRQLHSHPEPSHFDIGILDPFVRLRERIDATGFLAADARDWITSQLNQLRKRWRNKPSGLPQCVVHGDAWVGNIVTTDDDRSILLDLERTSLGPPEWDLVHTAIKHTSFGWISAAQYENFARIYGHDVTRWEGFALFRDIRELRMTTAALQAAHNPTTQRQAHHRLACLRGTHGPRPWNGWYPIS